MSSSPVPADVREYLDSVEGDRGDSLREVFDVVHDAMPEGFELAMSFGMPGWAVPLSRYPLTYNKKPLAYVSLAAQKKYLALYLMAPYSDPAQDAAFRDEWTATGLPLDMGKSCLRFTSVEKVDLGIIARTVAATSVDDFIATDERIRG